jgi:AAA+ superfamily predicted ATPase
MTKGYFTLLAKTKLDSLTFEDKIIESDFSCITPEGNFVQLKYNEPTEVVQRDYIVKPGVYSINTENNKFTLQKTQFVNDRVLDQFVHTKHITDKINLFFNKIQVYYDNGFEVPKRGMLLYGPAGSGKTTAISKVIEQYGNDNKTAIVIWHTAKFEAHYVKSFIQSFDYHGVDKLILIAEDIGGLEKDEVRRASDSSLLSLLDNQEKTFTLPVLIIGTTNHPETFLGNLTNRPNRFDDKIEVGYPEGDARAELLKFFSKNKALESDLNLIKEAKFKGFTPAHIREIWIRTQIYDKSISDCLEEMYKEIEKYNKGFSNQTKLGF